MRLLCVGRHAYLSEHLCRYFRELGADCAAAVGASDAHHVASSYEPHVIVCDVDLITPALLDSWAAEPILANVPVLAVSLTRRPEETTPVDPCGLAAVIYLPSLDREQAVALLAAVHRPRGVAAPPSWRMNVSVSSVPTS